MCKIPKWTIICLYLLTFTSLCASASSTGERNGRYKRTLLDLFPSLKTKRLTKDMISLLNERHSRPKRANPDFENLLYSLYLPQDDRGRSKRKFRKYNLFTLSGLHDSDVLENELSVDSSTTPIPIEAIMQMNVPELQKYIFDGDNVKYKEHYLGDDVLLKQMTPQNIAIRAGSSTANLTTTTELEDACTDLVTEALQTTSTAPTTVTKTTPVLVTEASTLTTVQTPSTASTLSTQKTSTTPTLITDVQTSADLTLTTNTTRDLSTEVINISSASISVADTTRPSTTESSQTTSSTLTSVTDTTSVSTTESSQTTTATHTSVIDTIRPSTTESSQTTSSTLTSVTDTTQVSTTESLQTTTATHTSVTDNTSVSTTESSQTTSTTPTSTTDTTPVSTTESSQTTTATHTSVTDTIRPSTTESSQTTTTTHTSVTDTTQASTTKSSQTTSTTPTSTTDTTRATTTESSQTTSTTRASVTDSTQDVPSTNSVETNVQISTTIAVTYSTTKLTTSTDIVTPSITSTESITSIETTNEIPTLNTAEYLNLLAKYGPENQKTFGDDFFNTLPFIYYRTSYEGLENSIRLPSFRTLGYSSVGITEANNVNNECQKYKSFFAQKTYKRFVEEVARRVAEQMTAKRNSDASVMEKILGEIEGIKNLASTNKDQKPGMFCDLNGSWTSASGGMRIDITKATDGSVKASLAERTPKKRLVEGFLGDASWKITATMPFKNSGLIILNAVHEEDRHAATFIGECKYCDNSEIVTGHWLLGRTSRDCKDQKAAHRLIGDVWRRENLNILRKQRLAELLTKPKRSG